MARFKGAAALPPGMIVPREKQLGLFDRLEELRARSLEVDPAGPAIRLFWIVLTLSGAGLLVQASHAATTQAPDAFWSGLWSQVFFRAAALGALLMGFRFGPAGVRRFLPFLVVLSLVALALVYVPGIPSAVNGSRRWLPLPGGLTFQPSELARIVMILWVADRCIRLGPDVTDWKRGVWPMLRLGLVAFTLIVCETDLGGALLFLLCFLITMWSGGARLSHVSGPFVFAVGAALLALLAGVSYVQHRLEMWLGRAQNDQVLRSTEAIASGDWFGVGLGQGLFRNAGVPYLESDYVFALVGEELGYLGQLGLIALFLSFLWYGLRLVLSIHDRFAALCCFGLVLSVALQAMVHLQVVSGLAPPKGMTLPFVSHGGTSLVVSSLAVGLALGAARSRKSPHPSVPDSQAA
ncbi:MAG: FtsW/RodA/SpoVE family cell cycle protein [Planctomycetes bacterium]|nr:FtsW/RodA/SpoVE family cell cycle protein [Planctomycetota bacterium]